ncbi:universal stress protein [Streptomyces sp. NBC_01340]|uniref:universal stress protein n=1 Tax=unclassified Streptomyces TaxID=2593676 RepID=UPI00225C11DC|nr:MULTISPECIES: universal stress protein [unclassified Streptomyces]MCX4462082.1 universal stress protein [Streptomyces sp. NBC_01719]MCX4490990.1 universal stress protein [Streptomyces sp. NBC_01728]WSI36324.1 universal stress protein [Streptomyces sp. NBC_01340]
MPRTVTVGLDGSSESRAAADWAAREAKLRGLPLKLVNVWEPVPEPIAQAPLLGPETHQHWSERSEMGVPPAEGWGSIPREAAEELRAAHPEVDVLIEQVTGRPAEVLADAATDAELLVLGSRGLSGVGGFMVGSVGLAVVAHAERPVVLVRAEGDTSGTDSDVPPSRPVVLGLDTRAPDDTLIGFAFEAALLRGTSLRVVHGWDAPPYIVHGMAPDFELNAQIAAEQGAALTEALRPWKRKFPDLQIVEDSLSGKAADHLVDASSEASLVVVGRRIRRAALGAHIGPVTHAVLHHATAPVAVVPHD